MAATLRSWLQWCVELCLDLFGTPPGVAVGVKLDCFRKNHMSGSVHLNATALVGECRFDEGGPARFCDDATDVLIMLPLSPGLSTPTVEHKIHGAE